MFKKKIAANSFLISKSVIQFIFIEKDAICLISPGWQSKIMVEEFELKKMFVI